MALMNRCHGDDMNNLATHFSLAVLVRPDQWCAPSFTVFRTCCDQLHPNLANLEATVKVGYSDGTIYRIVSNIAILRPYRGISLLR